MEKQRLTLYKQKRFRIYEALIVCIYSVYAYLYFKARAETLAYFFSYPIESRILKYTDDEIAYFKEFGLEIPPLKHTATNILYRWSHTDYYDGIKLLFLAPVTLHLAYLLFVYWSGTFHAHATLKRTNDPDQTSHVMIRITSQLNNMQRNVLAKVEHYIYNMQRIQRIEFEGEQYRVDNSNGEFTLKAMRHSAEITDLDLKTTGLTQAELHHRYMLYGHNRIVLRYPNYFHILKDSVFSPFFAFQVFSSILYAIDQFALYSILNIIMLVFVEGANVFSKYNAKKQTCKLAPRAVRVLVRRDGEEVYVSSDSLVPGDVVILKKYDYDAIAGDFYVKKPTREYMTASTMASAIPFLKLAAKFRELLFSKYYDESVIAHLKKLEFSHIIPVDMIVLEGQLIADEQVLTGEQASQIKEAIDQEQREDRAKIYAQNIFYGGTSLIQIQSERVECYVIRTAEQTVQGKLIKAIAFNEERMNVTTKDSLVFLAIMFVIAVCSAAYCFLRGYKTKIATVNRLFLESLMVLVNVVAPDLPTELSMCISNSIREIRKKKIFSTEPYRILNAGRLKYVCFDKSGTLTYSNIKILSIDDYLCTESIKKALDNVKKTYYKISAPNEFAELVVSACQSITQTKGKFYGDSLEVNAFNAVGSLFVDVNNVASKKFDKIQVVKRFYFNSTLKRMSVVVYIKQKQYVLTKGGPEILETLFSTVPRHYHQVVDEYVRCGLRVLALAYRPIDYTPDMTREDVEQNLTFAGLLICQTPLKVDTTNAIYILKDSDHLLKVISGDHVLNVAVTCKYCGIIGAQQNTYVVDALYGGDFICSNIQGADTMRLSRADFLKSNAAFCLTNSNACMDALVDDKEIVEKVTVFARATPYYKQQIIRTLKTLGAYVSYVGDGCNDLNALQESDVGIALMEEYDKEVVAYQERAKVPYPSFMGPNNTLPTPMALMGEAQARAAYKQTNYQAELRILLFEQQNYKRYLSLQKQKEKQGILQMWSDVLDQEEDTNEIKMGDATIAAHFTIKSGSLDGVLDIIRQGRCTLTTVYMNFKTTALNCLIGAFAMTVLTLSGVRSSDQQMIAESVLSMVIMMNIGKVKEAQHISRKKPAQYIVGPYLLCSMFGQAIVHIGCLFAGMSISHYARETVKFSTPFAPTEMNTSIFYIRLIYDACVTLINYPGKPHMQSIFEHKMVLLGIFLYCAGAWFLMSQRIPELNYQLKLVTLNAGLQMKIIGLWAVDMVACWLVEFLSKTFLS